MQAEELRELLKEVWRREISADDAWLKIDAERERPSEHSLPNEYWLPIYGD